tara:strand:+ start:3946 stop:11205 length:7260 start_codon:yes stop_codon:yes gene_type:complete
MPAFKAGISGLKSDVAAVAGRSGIMDIPAAEQYRAEQKKYQEETFKPTATWGEAPLTKFAELAGGALPYMAAPVAAGAAAAALPVSAPIGAAIGMGAAGLASATQFTGSGLTRQVEEGTPLAQTNLGSAVAAAIPSAALDMVSLKMMPGIRQIFAAAGKEVPEAVAKKIAEQGLKDTLKDYGVSTLKTMGVEGLTETGQQVLERMQAGLDITDPKARDEYLDSFIGGAVLGGAIAPVGRRFERGSEAVAQAKEAGTAKRAAAAEQQKAAAEAAAQEAANKQSPEYALKVANDYAAAEQAKADLLAQVRKVVRGSLTEGTDKAFNNTIYEQVRAQAPGLRELSAEHAQLEPAIKQAQEQQRVAKMTPEEYSLEQLSQQEGIPARGRTARMAALNQPVAPEEAAAAPEAAYAADRLALAKEQVGITADTSDYVNYLMTKPRMAQAIVDNQTSLPGLDRKTQNAVRGALKLQLQAAETQRNAAAQAGTANSQARIGAVEGEEQASIESQQAADAAEATRMETERADAERRIKIAPGVESLQRLGKAKEGTWSSPRADDLFRSLYQKQSDETQVDKLLSTLPMRSISTPGQIYAGMGFETASRRDLLTRIAVAKAHSGVEDVNQLQRELATLDAKPAANTEVATRLPGEGVLPEAEKKTVEAEKHADQQSQTLREYIRFLEDQKRGKVRGTLRLGRKERVETAGDGFKETFASQHVKELNARLEAFGLPQLTEVEAKIATGRVMRNLNELGERWGNDVPSNAIPGQQAFAAPVQAVEVLQEQMRSGMFKTVNDAADRYNLARTAAKTGATRTAEGGARIGTPDELKLRAESTVPKDDMRVATELAAQLRDTLDQRTYATPEQPATKGKEGSNRADMALTFGAKESGPRADINSRLASLDADTKDFVRLADDVLPEITDPALVTAIKEELQAIAEGRKLAPAVQQDLTDFVTGKAKAGESTTRPGATPEELQRTSAAPQMGLPGFEAGANSTQRATPKNFQKMLDSKEVTSLKSLVVEAQKAKKELVAAEKVRAAAAKTERADAAVKEANAAKQKEVAKSRAAAQRGREGLELPGLRVTVDTTKMQSQISAIRSALGSLDAQLAAETDPTKKAGIQKRIDATEAKFESVYADAPRITTALQEKDQLALEAQFDAAQVAAYDKQAAKTRIRQGEYGPALAPRRQGGVERTASGALVVQVGEKRATPATEMAGSALERVAQERAALRELEDRVAFLRKNGKNKLKGRLTEPFKALQEKVLKQAALVKQFEEAQRATVAAVRDVNKENRTGKAMSVARQERLIKAVSDNTGDSVSQLATPDVELGPKIEVDTEESAGAVMHNIAQTAKDPISRAIAERLQFLLGATKVNIVEDLRDDKGNPVYGSAKVDGSSISLDAKEGTNERTVLHEGIHAATERVLRMPDAELTEDQRAAKRELKALYEAYKADAAAPNVNARENVSEFLSEALSDPELKSYLEGKKWTMRNMWNGLKNGILKLLGIKVPANMLEATLAAADRLMTKVPRAVEGAEAVSIARPKYSTQNALTDLAEDIVASPKSFKERMGSNLGLELEMNAVDMRAGLREALKRGAKELGDDTLFTQAMYNVIKSDQRMPLVQTTMTNGPLEMYTDAKGLKGWRSTNKNSAVDVFAAISAIPGGNSQAKINMATVYMVAQRAANKGLAKLDIGALGVTQAKLDAVMAAVNADPDLKQALEGARTAYNLYNEGMINALASTGAIHKALAAKLLKDGDYVPFYRVNENGMADLVFSNEVTINIGDVRHQPYLAELKGGESKLLPLSESLPRNTLLLTDKMLTNLATKNVAYAMQAFGEGRGQVDKAGRPTNAMPIHKGAAPAGSDIIKFNQEPDVNDPKDAGQRWQRIQTAGTSMEGIPAELVVKSLEGAHLTLPAFLKIGGIAGDWLRSGVTRMPMYLVRQLVRDPMAASFTGGLNYGPLTAVAKAGREFIAMSRGTSETGAKLLEKGLIQSGIFTGDPSDLSKMALQIASGKDQGALDGFLAKLDRAAMRADAATRTQVYDNAIANGLSEVEADMMTMESMNFYKRGLSPTVQYASRLIPFFNAQIQGLNVLYKAARGQMPFEEQQQIQRKFMNNAMLLVGTGIVYAMAMDDDEYFKNAKPRDKYSNFFMHIPGVAEPLKIPIPYEAGWFFSLAVAGVDAMKAETDGKQQWAALRDIFLSAIPGYSSAGMPQAVKPTFEVWTNKNFFSGSTIESARMERLSVQERFSASTTEAAKALSKAVPLLSPVQIEHLANGYFGQFPLVVAAAADGLFRREGTGVRPESRITETPFVGRAFQKKFGGADTEIVYRDATKAVQARATFNKMRVEGRADAAKAFMADNRVAIASAGMAGNYQVQMGRLRRDSDRVTNNMPQLDAQEKRARLDKIEEARQSLSDRYRAALNRIEQATDRTTPQ